MKTIITKSSEFFGIEIVVLPDDSVWVTQKGYSEFSNIVRSTICARCKKYPRIEPSSIMDCVLPKDDETMIKTKIEGINRYVVLIPSKVFTKWMIRDIPEFGHFLMKIGSQVFLLTLTNQLAHMDYHNYVKKRAKEILDEHRAKVVTQTEVEAKKKNRKYVNVRLTPENHEKLLGLAEIENKSITDILNGIIQNY